MCIWTFVLFACMYVCVVYFIGKVFLCFIGCKNLPFLFVLHIKLVIIYFCQYNNTEGKSLAQKWLIFEFHKFFIKQKLLQDIAPRSRSELGEERQRER
jgi:hypothetical protein